MARTAIAPASPPYTFTGSDGTQITAGGEWTHVYDTGWSTGPVIAGNAVGPNALDHSHGQACRWNGAGTFSDDQYAKIALNSFGNFGGAASTEYGVGVIVRASADLDAASDYYAAAVYDDAANGGNKTVRITKRLNGTLSTLATHTSTAWTNGDTISLEVTTSGADAVLTVFKNDVSISFSHTDSTSPLASGKPGLIVFGDSGGDVPRGDDWEGGDVTSGTVIPVGAGSLVVTGLEPTPNIASGSILTGLGSVALTGLAPTATVTVTISTVPLKNNTGSVLGSVSGIRAFVNDATTGELVLLKTGLSTNAAGNRRVGRIGR
jgi:hypothetical protein